MSPSLAKAPTANPYLFLVNIRYTVQIRVLWNDKYIAAVDLDHCPASQVFWSQLEGIGMIELEKRGR